MGDTWGISGWQFLFIYIALVGLALFFAQTRPLLAADVIAWPWRPQSKSGAPDVAESDRFTIAGLAGGPPRIAAVAVAGPLLSGRMRVDRDGRLTGAVESGEPGGREGQDTLPLEASALKCIRQGRDVKLRDVSSVFTTLDEVKAIQRQLLEARLLVKPYSRSHVIQGVLLLCAVLLLGLLRVGFGIFDDQPVLALVLVMFIIAPAFLAALLKLTLGDTWPTRAGKALVRDMTTRYAGTVGPVGVAIFGLDALGDDELAGFLRKGAASPGDGGCAGCGGGGCGGCGG